MADEEYLKFLYEPCESKEELRLHMKAFIGIDLPDSQIDENSTSSPLEFIWSVYQVMKTGKGPTRHVVAASRGTTKTLSASVARFYGMIHFRRDGTHLAATEEQSKSANMYLDRFLNIEGVKEFVATSNTKTRELVDLPKNSHTSKSAALLRVAVATPAGVNSQRGSLNTRDELDLVPPGILSEASFVSEPTQDEYQFAPIEISLSSRKSNDGPIQDMLDESEAGDSRNLKAHKWSLVDWMKKCPTEVHRPDKERINAYINIETLKTVWGDKNYEAMSSAEKSLQKRVHAYDGCRTCPAFLVCQARSPKQTENQKVLRSIEFVESLIAQVRDPDKIIAQALNWQPESSAIVFRVFNRSRHFMKPIRAYKWLFGEYFNPKGYSEEYIEDVLKNGELSEVKEISPTKGDIYDELVRQDWNIHYGIDWGYRPDPAACVVVAYHRKQRRAFILHLEMANEYANQDWAQYVHDNIWSYYPGDLVAPDTEDSASVSYFRPLGMTCLSKKPKKVETGVSQIRSLLWSPDDQIENLVVLDDQDDLGQNVELAKAFEKWTYRKTATGYDYTKFDIHSEYKHQLDATRYALAPFLLDQNVRFRSSQPKDEQVSFRSAGAPRQRDPVAETEKVKPTARSMLEQHMREEYGISDIHKDEEELKQKQEERRSPKEEESPRDKKRKQSGTLKFRF